MANCFGSEWELIFQGEYEIFCPAGRGNHAVGQGFPQFGAGGACFLRGREVFLQSGGAPDRHGAADPDQLPGPGIQHFLVGEIQDLLANLHIRTSGMVFSPTYHRPGTMETGMRLALR